MGLDPLFTNIAHTADTLTVDFFASGPGWSGGGDESWAIENVSVSLNGTVPEPASLMIWGDIAAACALKGLNGAVRRAEHPIWFVHRRHSH